MTFDPTETPNPGANIKVIGVGGGGTNAVSTMLREHIDGVEFISANTDIQSLRSALAPIKIQLGKELTKGLGAGSDPDIGRDAALEDRFEIQEALTGADMVFVTAGMGGGTGTGSAAVVSQIARELGALTVGVVTKPFLFEGKKRRRHAELGIERLREHVDTLITIPNQRLLQIAQPGFSLVDAFQMVDKVLVNSVKGISDIINVPGTVNVDFADVKTIMSSMGHALMGIGQASGENRAITAAKQAISSPLLEDVNIEGATGILINITAGSEVSLLEVNEACMVVQDTAHEDSNIIFGAVVDESLGEMIQVTVIATGFPHEQEDDFTREEKQKEEMRKDLSSYQQNKTLIRTATPKIKKILTPPNASFARTEKPKAPIVQTKTVTHEPITQNIEKKLIVEEETKQDLKEPHQHEADQTRHAQTEAQHPKEENEVPYSGEIETNTQNNNSIETKDIGHEKKEELKNQEQTEEAKLCSEIDKRIDEALKLVERVKSVDNEKDNLDVPTFLREPFKSTDSNKESDPF